MSGYTVVDDLLVEKEQGQPKWADKVALRIYLIGDWFNIFIFGFYTLIIVLVFMKYRMNVKYDRVSLTVLILQFIAFFAMMLRSLIEIT